MWLQCCCRRGAVLLFALTAESHARKRILHCTSPLPRPHPADLILGDADLMRVFEPLMRRKDELREPLFELGAAFGDKAASTMEKLLTLVDSRRQQPFGVIIDEVQKITEAAERDKLAYFKEGWYGWQYSPGNAFVRMDIASSHGA